VQDFPRDPSIENGSIDQIYGNFLAIDRVPTNVPRRINKLTEMDLIVLDGDETNKVGPGRHLGSTLDLLKSSSQS